MSGTPLDLAPFGSVLTAIGWLYWLVALALIILALWLPKVPWQKIAAVAIVVVAVYLVFVRPVQTRVQEQRQEQQAAGARLEESMALFKKRCESAGERITRIVENVDGVVWLKWREPISNADNFADQFKLNDPYGHDCGMEGCILRLLRAAAGTAKFPQSAERYSRGYSFVESTDPRDGQKYRYIGLLKPVNGPDSAGFASHVQATGSGAEIDASYFTFEQMAVTQFTARYGVTWDDISTREDREHWIAGSSLKVVDLQTNEVVAERVGYMIDRGQGSQAGFRSPWLYAEYTACPAFDTSESRSPIKASRTRYFIQKVLKFNKGDQK